LLAFFLLRGSRGKMPMYNRVEWIENRENPVTTLPFKMHNRRKSASEHCSLLTAEERVTYALAAPAFPFVLRRPMFEGKRLSAVEFPPLKTFLDPDLVEHRNPTRQPT
jgi:hypothetical protein